eukprot:1208427-Karenia_brevis.AAC.1
MAFFSHLGQIMKEHLQMGRDDCRSEGVSELRAAGVTIERDVVAKSKPRVPGAHTWICQRSKVLRCHLDLS